MFEKKKTACVLTKLSLQKNVIITPGVNALDNLYFDNCQLVEEFLFKISTHSTTTPTCHVSVKVQKCAQQNIFNHLPAGS